MNNNNITFYGSNEGAIEFINSSIKASTEMIEHYDFVIKDISSSVSDISLENSKEPAIKFLKAMRAHWSEFQTNLHNELDRLQKEIKNHNDK